VKKKIQIGLVSLVIVAFVSWLILQFTAWLIPTWFALSVHVQKHLMVASLGVGMLTLLAGLCLNLVRQRKQEQE
jgi:uncharacterized membrane protein